MRKRIALIRPIGSDALDDNIADYNVGVRQLARVAEGVGVDVDLHDPFENVANFDPSSYQVIGFYVHHLNIVESLELACEFKAGGVNPFIVFGGDHASAAAAELLRDNSFIDAVCVGEGEEFIASIAKALLTGERLSRFVGEYCTDRLWALDEIPHHEPPPNSTIVRISTSRGCPLDCSFCTTPAIRRIAGLPVLRTASPESVVEEIRRNVKKGARQVRINDDVYVYKNTKSRERVSQIAQMLLNEKISIDYKAEFRIDAFSDSDLPILQNLRKSGMSEVFIGIETGSDTMLKELNKGMSMSDTRRLLKLYHDAHIIVNPGAILATPDSTIANICASVEEFRKCGFSYMFFRRRTFRLHVFPGTKLEKQLLEEDRLEAKARYLPRKYKFTDQRVHDIVELFEDGMPDLLPQITGFFKERKNAIHRAHLEPNTDDNKRNLSALNTLNEAVARLLINWFLERSTSDIGTRQRDITFNALADLFKDTEGRLRGV